MIRNKPRLVELSFESSDEAYESFVEMITQVVADRSRWWIRDLDTDVNVAATSVVQLNRREGAL